MKNLYLYLWGAIVAMLTLNACTDEANLPVSEENPQEESSLCTFTIPEVPVHGIDGSSRTAISIVDNILKFVWAEGDRIGILPDEGSQVYFTIDAQAAGGTSASFDGGAWALKANHQYDAYFPFVPDIMLDRTAVPVDYTNQQQTGNNSMAHLGAHDYLAAKGTTNGQGGVNYNFQRMGAVAILKFTVPDADTNLKSVTLKANETCFTTKGKLDMGELTIKNMEKSASLTVGVDYTTTEANEEVTVYFMCYPDQLEDKNLNVEVNYDGSEEPLYFTTKGKNMVAGDGYLMEAKKKIPYLTFAASDEQTFTITAKETFWEPFTLPESLQYSVGDGDWTQLTSGTEISFGGDKGTLRLRGKSSIGTAKSTMEYSQIAFGNGAVKVACTGDIRTLVDWENYATASTEEARFIQLFYGCTALTTAPELPATTLASDCYYYMFYKCTSLTTAPELPATTLASSCYYYMFGYCTSLTTAPELPADTLTNFCYTSMFGDCTSLTTAPELPADTLADCCYRAMFQDCTSLTTAPVLPATNLADECYFCMFQNCTSLTTAPVLPATTLTKKCYQNMFNGCTNLSSITMLATDISAEYCLDYWVDGVSSSGTFYKNSAANWEATGISGIPTGWNVETYEAPED